MGIQFSLQQDLLEQKGGERGGGGAGRNRSKCRWSETDTKLCGNSITKLRSLLLQRQDFQIEPKTPVFILKFDHNLEG